MGGFAWVRYGAGRGGSYGERGNLRGASGEGERWPLAGREACPGAMGCASPDSKPPPAESVACSMVAAGWRSHASVMRQVTVGRFIFLRGFVCRLQKN